jgi:NAD-dependent dihydropyrimidine dehydrogenase PreA subunit
MSEESKMKQNPHSFMGVPREQIDWYPTINPDKCNNCKDCAEFCAHDVYSIENDRVVVKNPKNCVVFCQACLKMCPIEGAMQFQAKKDVLAQIKSIKQGMKNE